MSSKQAEDIVNVLLNTSLNTKPPRDVNENPAMGGTDSVNGYDKDGNILFIAAYSDVFTITFQDGTCYEFEKNDLSYKLFLILNLEADYPHVSGDSRVRGGFILSADNAVNEKYPNPIVHMGHGTQAELDRLRELLQSPELYRINGYTGYEGVLINMSDKQAMDIVDFLIDAPISFIPPDVQENPSMGGSESVKGYDRNGNFLFEFISYGICAVRFQDGTFYDFYFDGSDGQLYDYLGKNY